MDTIGNLLTSLINAQRVGKTRVIVPYSQFGKSLIELLRSKGYVAKVDERERQHKELVVTLRYDDGVGRIRRLRRLSSPGQRRYVASDAIPFAADGLGLIIVSTSRGLMDDVKARKERIGGELVCEVW